MVWSWSSPWHLRSVPLEPQAYHPNECPSKVMFICISSIEYKKTDSQISITTTVTRTEGVRPVLELTKIIPRKLLASSPPTPPPQIPTPQMLFYWEISESCVLRVNFLCSCFCFQILVFIQDLTQITNEIKRAETAATNATSAMSWVAKHLPAN